MLAINLCEHRRRPFGNFKPRAAVSEFDYPQTLPCSGRRLKLRGMVELPDFWI